MQRIRLAIVLALLIGGAILAAIGATDGRVNLKSILTIWSDTARDADQIGMRLTRLGDRDEMKIGSDLASTLLGLVHEDTGASKYITEVAQFLLPYVRRHGISYSFHVIESTQVNAFAMPGGQVFVTSGLLGFVENEAELAIVLGHEIAHVDLRHCVERYQYQYRLKNAGAPEIGWLVEMAHRMATMGFSSYQESEADAAGEELVIKAGYNPQAAVSLFLRMKKYFGEPSPQRAATPSGEVEQAVDDAIGSYFRTHPPSADRARQFSELLARHPELKGRSFYVGKENLRKRSAGSPALQP